MSSPLVTTDWLFEHLHDARVRIADASWYLPQAGHKPRAEYDAAHIPGAVFFDIDAISDRATDLPHMLPAPEDFAASMRSLGIGNDDLVVLYDGAGVYSAPRGLWMLCAMGHDKSVVLDGGLRKWRREGRPVTDTMTPSRQADFTARRKRDLVRSAADIRTNLSSGGEQVLDARSAPRFRGEEEQEPRPGVRPGHIPGSVNVHYADVLTPEGTMRPLDCLRVIFGARGVDLERPVVTSFGSGITAAILSLALEIAGAKRIALYDGSWAEWGAVPDAPIKTGAKTEPAR